MVSGLFHIKINGNDENKDNGFLTLLTSGASVFCLKDEEYVIPEEAVEKLKKRGIDFEPINKVEGSEQEEKNATKT
jgi:hypothetical protein